MVAALIVGAISSATFNTVNSASASSTTSARGGCSAVMITELI